MSNNITLRKFFIWNSKWFCDYNYYNLLFEDLKITNYIQSICRYLKYPSSNFIIKRDLYKIIIYSNIHLMSIFNNFLKKKNKLFFFNNYKKILINHLFLKKTVYYIFRKVSLKIHSFLLKNNTIYNSINSFTLSKKSLMDYKKSKTIGIWLYSYFLDMNFFKKLISINMNNFFITRYFTKYLYFNILNSGSAFFNNYNYNDNNIKLDNVNSIYMIPNANKYNICYSSIYSTLNTFCVKTQRFFFKSTSFFFKKESMMFLKKSMMLLKKSIHSFNIFLVRRIYMFFIYFIDLTITYYSIYINILNILIMYNKIKSLDTYKKHTSSYLLFKREQLYFLKVFNNTSLVSLKKLSSLKTYFFNSLSKFDIKYGYIKKLNKSLFMLKNKYRLLYYIKSFFGISNNYNKTSINKILSKKKVSKKKSVKNKLKVSKKLLKKKSVKNKFKVSKKVSKKKLRVLKKTFFNNKYIFSTSKKSFKNQKTIYMNWVFFVKKHQLQYYKYLFYNTFYDANNYINYTSLKRFYNYYNYSLINYRIYKLYNLFFIKNKYNKYKNNKLKKRLHYKKLKNKFFLKKKATLCYHYVYKKKNTYMSLKKNICFLRKFFLKKKATLCYNYHNVSKKKKHNLKKNINVLRSKCKHFNIFFFIFEKKRIMSTFYSFFFMLLEKMLYFDVYKMSNKYTSYETNNNQILNNFCNKWHLIFNNQRYNKILNNTRVNKRLNNIRVNKRLNNKRGNKRLHYKSVNNKFKNKRISTKVKTRRSYHILKKKINRLFMRYKYNKKILSKKSLISKNANIVNRYNYSKNLIVRESNNFIKLPYHNKYNKSNNRSYKYNKHHNNYSKYADSTFKNYKKPNRHNHYRNTYPNKYNTYKNDQKSNRHNHYRNTYPNKYNTYKNDQKSNRHNSNSHNSNNTYNKYNTPSNKSYINNPNKKNNNKMYNSNNTSNVFNKKYSKDNVVNKTTMNKWNNRKNVFHNKNSIKENFKKQHIKNKPFYSNNKQVHNPNVKTNKSNTPFNKNIQNNKPWKQKTAMNKWNNRENVFHNKNSIKENFKKQHIKNKPLNSNNKQVDNYNVKTNKNNTPFNKNIQNNTSWKQKTDKPIRNKALEEHNIPKVIDKPSSDGTKYNKPCIKKDSFNKNSTNKNIFHNINKKKYNTNIKKKLNFKVKKFIKENNILKHSKYKDMTPFIRSNYEYVNTNTSNQYFHTVVWPSVKINNKRTSTSHVQNKVQPFLLNTLLKKHLNTLLNTFFCSNTYYINIKVKNINYFVSKINKACLYLKNINNVSNLRKYMILWKALILYIFNKLKISKKNIFSRKYIFFTDFLKVNTISSATDSYYKKLYNVLSLYSTFFYWNLLLKKWTLNSSLFINNIVRYKYIQKHYYYYVYNTNEKLLYKELLTYNNKYIYTSFNVNVRNNTYYKVPSSNILKLTYKEHKINNKVKVSNYNNDIIIKRGPVSDKLFFFIKKYIYYYYLLSKNKSYNYASKLLISYYTKKGSNRLNVIKNSILLKKTNISTTYCDRRSLFKSENYVNVTIFNNSFYLWNSNNTYFSNTFLDIAHIYKYCSKQLRLKGLLHLNISFFLWYNKIILIQLVNKIIYIFKNIFNLNIKNLLITKVYNNNIKKVLNAYSYIMYNFFNNSTLLDYISYNLIFFNKYVSYKKYITKVEYINDYMFFSILKSRSFFYYCLRYYILCFLSLFSNIENTIKKYSHKQCFLFMRYSFICNNYINSAKMWCEYIVYQLKKKISIRKVFWYIKKQQLQEQKEYNYIMSSEKRITKYLVRFRYPLRGIRILYSGNFKKAKRKQKLYYYIWVANFKLTGSMPIQKFKYYIDYYSSVVLLKRSSIGLKFWLIFNTK